MNKKYLLIIQSCVVVVLLFSIVVLSSCSKQKPIVSTYNLSDLQVTACNSANDGGTCSTKLGELGIVTKDQCCKDLGKCC